MLTHQLELVSAKSAWADYALLMFIRHGTPVPDFDLRFPDCLHALNLTRAAITHAAALLDPTDPLQTMDETEAAQEIQAELLELNAGKTHPTPPALCAAVASAIVTAMSAAIGTPMWDAFQPGPVDHVVQAAFTGHPDALGQHLDTLATHVVTTHHLTDRLLLAHRLYEGLTAGYAVTPYEQLTAQQRAPYARAADRAVTRAALTPRECHA